MMGDNSVLLDTNVLLSATSPARSDHDRAFGVLENWTSRGHRLCTSGQILREYLVVTTRPQTENGLGLDVAAALENVAQLSSRMRTLEETDDVTQQLLSLAAELVVTGKRIHDANIVATALTHKVPTILTANVRDFARFADRIEILSLADV